MKGFEMNKLQQTALKAAYRQQPPALGIITLQHLPSGRMLLTASRNAPGALNRHRFELKLGTHRNAALLADWRRDGETAFRCEIIDTVKVQDDPDFDTGGELASLLELHLSQLQELGQPFY